jgi:hypothetical protein
MNEIDSIKNIAEKYRKNGYTVVVEPSKDQIPFDLTGYRPDLLCKNAEEKLIIEVKSKKWKGSFDRFKNIADIVAQNPGWRFVLVVAEDSSSEENDIPTNYKFDPKLIKNGIERASLLMSSGIYDYAIVVLWNTLIYMMREKSMKEHYAVENLPELSIVKQLYSKGEISNQEYEEFLSFSRLRNQSVHAISSDIQVEDVAHLMSDVKGLQKRWFPESL